MGRRRGLRFDIQLACRFKCGGADLMVDATTLNVGRMGALVAANSSNFLNSIPQPGDRVDLEVLLPANQQFGQRCLSCAAVAVRATSEGDRCLIAFRFEQVEIRKVIAGATAGGQVAVM